MGYSVAPLSNFKTVFMTNEGTTNGKLPIGGVFAPTTTSANFFVLGHYAQAGAGPAAGWVLAMNSTDGAGAIVAPPLGFSLLWQDPPPNVNFDGTGFMPTYTDSLWMPNAPDGYAALGAVGKRDPYVGFDKTPDAPATSAVWCLGFDNVTTGTIGEALWTINNYNNPVSVYRIQSSNLFLAALSPPSAPLIPQPNSG